MRPTETSAPESPRSSPSIDDDDDVLDLMGVAGGATHTKRWSSSPRVGGDGGVVGGGFGAAVIVYLIVRN